MGTLRLSFIALFRNLAHCASLDDDGSTQTDLISVIQSFGRMSKSEQVEYLQLYNKYTNSGLEIEKNNAQWARKIKKVQAKKIVKSNKSKKDFFVKLHFWQF